MAGPSQVTIKIAAKLEKDFGSAISAAQKAVSGLKGLGGKMMESLGISAFDSEGKFIGLEATLQKVN